MWTKRLITIIVAVIIIAIIASILYCSGFGSQGTGYRWVYLWTYFGISFIYRS